MNDPSECGVSRAPAVGDYFAELARSEVAAACDLERLAHELEVHCAPRVLVKRTRIAANEKRRHARATEKIAARFGRDVSISSFEVAFKSVRDLFTIARENAANGCIREAYAALLAHEQARAASDVRVRLAMKRIAVDETRHAVLAWDIWRFCEMMLPREARAAIRITAECEARALRKELTRSPAPDVARAAGLPNATRAQAMLDGMLTTMFVKYDLAA